jgi:hypothetical protein
MHRPIAILFLVAAVGCVHHSQHRPTTTTGEAPARWVTQTPPPAGYTETQPPPPHTTDVWVPGWFKWDGKTFEWVIGRWVTPLAGTHEWVPGVWSERADGKWQFVDGHWQ